MTAHVLEGDCVLVGTDRSERSGCAARWAVEVARPFEWSVVLGHVVDWESVSRRMRETVLESEALEERYRFEVRDWYWRATEREPASVRLSVGEPAVQLARSVEECRAAMLVVAASGRSTLEQMALGSTPRTLLRHPPSPLVIVHPEYSQLPEEGTLVVGTDFSRASDAAVRVGAELARQLDWPMHLVHASRPDNRYLREEFLPKGLRRLTTARHRGVWMKRAVDRTREALDGVQLEPRIIDEMPARGLCRYIDAVGAEVAVLGHHRRGGYTPAILRSVALRCARMIRATLVVVPGPRG